MVDWTILSPTFLIAVVEWAGGCCLQGMYQWLDRALLGRNEHGIWWRRHDEYEKT